MPVSAPTDPDAGRLEALIVSGMALLAALALIGLSISIGAVHCPNNGVPFLLAPGVGIGAGVVMALVAAATMAAVSGHGRHTAGLVFSVLLLMSDGVLLVVFVWYAQHPLSGCYTF